MCPLRPEKTGGHHHPFVYVMVLKLVMRAVWCARRPLGRPVEPLWLGLAGRDGVSAFDWPRSHLPKSQHHTRFIPDQQLAQPTCHHSCILLATRLFGIEPQNPICRISPPRSLPKCPLLEALPGWVLI
jgi:hypothetical protein